jgi:biotin carboxyl carrier protein
MKTFNEVKEDTAGKIVRFLAENEEEIVAGHPLVELA